MKNIFVSNLLKRVALIVALLGVVTTLFVAVPQTDAINVFKNPEQEQSGAAGVVTNQGNTKTDFQSIVSRVVTILFTIIGILAVISIIIGGIRYATSNGDQAAIKSAKNTILYAVVGLVVAMLAFAIVNFVVARIK